MTTGKPRLNINPNKQENNMKKAVEDKQSTYYYYQRLIQIRKKHDILIYGRYELILEEHDQIYAYTRTLGDKQLVIITNLFDEEVIFTWPEELMKLDRKSTRLNSRHVAISYA